MPSIGGAPIVHRVQHGGPQGSLGDAHTVLLTPHCRAPASASPVLSPANGTSKSGLGSRSAQALREKYLGVSESSPETSAFSESPSSSKLAAASLRKALQASLGENSSPSPEAWGKDATNWSEGPWPRAMLGAAAWAPRWLVWAPRVAPFVRAIDSVLERASRRKLVEAFRLLRELPHTGSMAVSTPRSAHTAVSTPRCSFESAVMSPAVTVAFEEDQAEEGKGAAQAQRATGSQMLSEPFTPKSAQAVHFDNVEVRELRFETARDSSKEEQPDEGAWESLGSLAVAPRRGRCGVSRVSFAGGLLQHRHRGSQSSISSASGVSFSHRDTMNSQASLRSSPSEWSHAGESRRRTSSATVASSVSNLSHSAMRRTKKLRTMEENTLKEIRRKSLPSLCGMVFENLMMLASYVPSSALELMQRTVELPQPVCIEDWAACAIIDLSGFTKMCAELWSGVDPSSVTGVVQNGEASDEPKQQKGAGVLFRVTSQAERQGKAMEDAKMIINQAFDLLINAIAKSGGDIIRIAGDAIIVTFKVDRPPACNSKDLPTMRKLKRAASSDFPQLRGSNATAHSEQPPDLESERRCARQASQCTCECIKIARSGKIPMKVHAGMSFGKLRRFHVGGESTWQVVVAGQPLIEAGAALDASEKLEVLITKQMWSLVQGDDRFIGRVSPQGGDFIILEPCTSAKRSSELCQTAFADGSPKDGSQSAPADLIARQASASDPADLMFHIHSDASARSVMPRRSSAPIQSTILASTRLDVLEKWKVNVPDVVRKSLMMYVPDVVQQGIVTGVAGALSEIRKLTCVFIEIGLDLVSKSPIESLEVLSSVFQTILRHAVEESEGTVKELTCDDKGLVAVLGFGLRAPSATLSKRLDGGNEFHSSSKAACMAAHRIEKEMRQLHSVNCYIGIASGMVFCATLGNDARREFTMVSSAMNTAARLMGAVKKGKARGGKTLADEVIEGKRCCMLGPELAMPPPIFTESILCTQEVVAEASTSSQVEFHKLDEIPLKGYEDPVPIYLIGVVEFVSVKRDRRLSSGDTSKSPEDDGRSCASAPLSLASWAPGPLARRDDDVKCLAYQQFQLLAPALFHNLIIPAEVLDYVWIRSSGGDVNRIAALVQQYSAAGEPAQGTNQRKFAHFSDLLDLGSSVPSNFRQQLSHQVAELSPLNQVVLKIVAVLGGYGECELIRYLLDNVDAVSAQWQALCEAYKRQWTKTRKLTEDGSSDDSDKSGSSWNDGEEEEEDSDSGLSEESCVQVQKLDILSVVVRDLQRQGWVKVDDDVEWVYCQDFLLIDSLYSALSFSHRRALHSKTVAWLRENRNSIEHRLETFPHLAHHLMMSNCEDRAAALLTATQCIATPTYIQDLVISQFQRYFPIVQDENSHLANYIRGMKALPAIPFLRGLAKALQQQCVGDKVLKAVKRFQDKFRKGKIRKAAAARSDSAASEAQTVDVEDVNCVCGETLQESPAACPAAKEPLASPSNGKFFSAAMQAAPSLASALAPAPRRSDEIPPVSQSPDGTTSVGTGYPIAGTASATPARPGASTWSTIGDTSNGMGYPSNGAACASGTSAGTANGVPSLLPSCDSSEACGVHSIESHFLLKLNTVASLDRTTLADLNWWRRVKFTLLPSTPKGGILSYASDQGECQQMTCMLLTPNSFKLYAPDQALQLPRLSAGARAQLLNDWHQYELAVLPHLEPTVSDALFPTQVFCIATFSAEMPRPFVMGATSWEQRAVWMSMLRSCEPQEVLAELPF